MSELPLLTMLFLGNAALFYMWAHYVIRVLKGECPHCGK